MIKNFDEVKAQLEQLAPIINSFQSEAVQMRIVELILGGGASSESSQEDASDTGNGDRSPAKRRGGRKNRRVSTPNTDEGLAKPRSSSGKPSAGATIDRLITDGFFKAARGLGDLVSHCATTLALQYKQSDFSPALVRAVRDGKLKRTKNESGQFEYEQP